MALATAIATRTITSTRQKQSFQTTQNQTFNILQHLFECSIAGICRDKRLFPDYFFLDYEANGDRLIVSKFDLEMLLRNKSSNSSSTSSASSCSTSSRYDDRDEQHECDDNLDENLYCMNTEHVSIEPSRSCIRKKKRPRIEIDVDDSNASIDSSRASTTKTPSLPSVSPLTFSMIPNTFQSDSFDYCDPIEDSSTNMTKKSSCNEDLDHEHCRIEALLLLHWIRHGIVEMMKRRQLARFYFAICTSSTPKDDDNDDDNDDDGQHGKDPIVESYMVR